MILPDMPEGIQTFCSSPEVFTIIADRIAWTLLIGVIVSMWAGGMLVDLTRYLVERFQRLDRRRQTRRLP